MAMAFCPDCEEPIHFKLRPKVGDRIVCSSCESELEVVEVSPLELDWAFDDPVEDWEDEDDDVMDDDDEDDWEDDEDEDDWIDEDDDQDG